MKFITRVKFRRATAALWTSNNPVLFEGEAGYETDTGKFKIGDGVTAWSGLAYSSGATGATGATGAKGDQGIQGEPGPNQVSDATETTFANGVLISDGIGNVDLVPFTGSTTKFLRDDGTMAIPPSSGSSPFFSVLDYGAVGDGVTNDATAIQAAITAAASGGELWFPPGVYYIGTTSLVLNRCIVVRGSGSSNSYASGGSVIKYVGTGAAILVNNGGGVEAEQVNISGIGIDCDGTGAYGIRFGSASGSPKACVGVFSGLYVTGATTAGYHLVSAQLCTFIQCEAMYNAGAAGWLVDSISGGDTTHTKFINCRAGNNKYGFLIKSGFNLVFDNADAESNTDEGVYVYQDSTASVFHNHQQIHFNNLWVESNNTATSRAVASEVAQVRIESAVGITAAMGLITLKNPSCFTCNPSSDATRTYRHIYIANGTFEVDEPKLDYRTISSVPTIIGYHAGGADVRATTRILVRSSLAPYNGTPTQYTPVSGGTYDPAWAFHSPGNVNWTYHQNDAGSTVWTIDGTGGFWRSEKVTNASIIWGKQGLVYDAVNDRIGFNKATPTSDFDFVRTGNAVADFLASGGTMQLKSRGDSTQTTGTATGGGSLVLQNTNVTNDTFSDIIAQGSDFTVYNKITFRRPDQTSGYGQIEFYTKNGTLGLALKITRDKWLEMASGCKIRSGTGSPESVYSAPVGSLFFRSDGGASTTLYVKESGSGNTGWIAYGAGGGVSDGDKGDITVSGSGATWTIDNGVVTYAKIQNVSATDKVLGRSTAGAGSVEEIDCTSAGRSMIGAADAAAQYALLTKLTTQGDILTRGASADQRLAVGSRGKTLLSDGTDPVYSYDNLTGAFENLSAIEWVVGATTSTFSTFGDNISANGTPSASAGDANQPPMINGASGAVAGNAAGWYGASMTIPRQQPKVVAIIRLVDTTSIRIWVSLHDGNSTSGTNADDPASRNLMGFRFSTDAGDTNWRCCTKDGSTLNNQDSGVAPSTSGVTRLMMDHTGSSVKFYINGTLVATSSSNLPSSTAACRLQIYAETRTTAAKNIRAHSAAVVRSF